MMDTQSIIVSPEEESRVLTSPGNQGCTFSHNVIVRKSGRTLLSEALVQVRQSLQHDSNTPLMSEQTNKLQRSYLKNLAVLSIGFFFLFSSFFALRNSQSSIHHYGDLGLASLACIYGSFVIGCIVSVCVIRKIRPKHTILWASLGQLIYTATNFYPMYTSLIPASILLGLSLAHMWTAQGTYITSLAISYAAITSKAPENIIGLFNGFFLFVLQLSHIAGNLLSSAVFAIDTEGSITMINSTDTQMLLSNNVCIWSSEQTGWMLRGLHVERTTILIAILSSLNIAGILVLSIFLGKLDVIFCKNKQGSLDHMKGLLQLHKDKKMLLLLPLMIYLGMEEGFVYGELTHVFVSCPVGLHMVGLAMVCFCACNSITSFLIGCLQASLGRVLILSAGGILNLGLLMFLFFWEGDTGVAIVFVVIIALGVVDGIWQTQACNICGLVFGNEVGFASLRMYEAVGFCVAFTLSTLISTHNIICVNSAMLVVALALFYGMEYTLQKEKDDKV